ncbi:nucleotidyltransferase family protein [Rhodothermus marinus]|uniref:DNA polymerase beta domain protein region n=1 Tax=Rhodothermus marinus (strain ATCC 43812 / DSM 4252 / R-10) TaxID=518766 RepID=D0MFB6_RHOM4|nr:nucleotidyltransferase [Rhodothermus marinus]ACY49372.1 DNA polymerase beta domain protein region [Rhodothermus marinus DSM 4252]
MSRLQRRVEIIQQLHRLLPELQEKFGVERLALYGSFARDQASEASDVDLIVHLNRPLGLDFIRLIDFLEAHLGRPVDLATYETLQRNLQQPHTARIAQRILRSLQYVSASQGH